MGRALKKYEDKPHFENRPRVILQEVAQPRDIELKKIDSYVSQFHFYQVTELKFLLLYGLLCVTALAVFSLLI